MPADLSFDKLISSGSVPNLGALYRAGQKAGLIREVQGYPKAG